MKTNGPKYYMLTFTAPGIVEHCKKPGCDKAPHCVHEICGCTPSAGTDLAAWNPTCGRKWNTLLKLIERRYGVRPSYFRAVEVQNGHHRQDNIGRGALHLHVLVRIDRVMTVKGNKRKNLPGLRHLAIEAGFGHEVDLKELIPGSREAARYVSKYVTKSADSRDDVPWLVEDLSASGEVIRKTAPTYRTWSQSRDWAPSMKALREIARRKWETTQQPPAGCTEPAGGGAGGCVDPQPPD